MYKYLMEGKEEGTRLISAVFTERTRGSGHRFTDFKKDTQNFIGKQEYTFFNYCEGAQTLEQVVQRCHEVSIWGDIKNSAGQLTLTEHGKMD